MPRLRFLATLVVGVLLTTVLPADAAERRVAQSWPVSGSSTIDLAGRGFGHGRGMSQYGARGAAKAGKTWREIIEFYYPGTTWGQASGHMRVLITADTTPDLQVLTRRGLTVRSLRLKRTWTLPGRRATRWRLQGVGQRTRVQFTRGAGWITWRQFRGEAEFVSTSGPMTLVVPGGRARYRGRLRSSSSRVGGPRQTVNVVGLEAYLRGVVPREVPALWEADAVAAQSVAARTYAAFERTRPAARHYDLCDTSQCQVYGGVDDEHPASTAAIRTTRGHVLHHEGAPAFTQFSASSGGWTAVGSMPYLVAQRDPYDRVDNPRYHTWQHSISDRDIERRWPALGDLTRISVQTRDGNGQWGGRVLQMTLTGTRGTVRATGDDFRLAFGLNSSWFTVDSVTRRRARTTS